MSQTDTERRVTQALADTTTLSPEMSAQVQMNRGTAYCAIPARLRDHFDIEQGDRLQRAYDPSTGYLIISRGLRSLRVSGTTFTISYNRIIHMGSTIRVSDNTKELLNRLKQEDETYDELLARLAREGDTMNSGVWDEEQADAAREVLKQSRQSFEQDR